MGEDREGTVGKNKGGGEMLTSLEKTYRHKKKLSSNYAADVFITNSGGTILWLGDGVDSGDRILTQEEIGLYGIEGFSRVMRKKLYWTRKGQYVIHRQRRFYLSDFYRR